MEYHLTDEITVSTGLIGPISEQVGTPRVAFRVPRCDLNLNISNFTETHAGLGLWYVCFGEK